MCNIRKVCKKGRWIEREDKWCGELKTANVFLDINRKKVEGNYYKLKQRVKGNVRNEEKSE